MDKRALIVATALVLTAIICVGATSSPTTGAEPDRVTIDASDERTEIVDILNDYNSTRPNLELTINLSDEREYTIDTGTFGGNVPFYGKSLVIDGDPDGDGVYAKVKVMGNQQINTNEGTGATAVLRNIDFSADTDGGDYAQLAMFYYKEVTVQDSKFDTLLLHLSSTDVEGSKVTARNLVMESTAPYSGKYALTIKGSDVTADNVDVDGYDRGINMELPTTGSPSAFASECDVSDVKGKCAMQVSFGTASAECVVSDCSFNGCTAAFSIHDTLADADVRLTQNTFSGCGTDILYSVNVGERSDATVTSIVNTFDGNGPTVASEDVAVTIPPEPVFYVDFDPDSGEYRISTEEDLFIFAGLVNSGIDFADKTVYLDTDVDLTGDAWIPIGNGSRDDDGSSAVATFAGTFVGNDHKITGLSAEGYSPSSGSLDADGGFLFGLFGHVSGDAEIYGLVFDGIDIDLPSTDASAPVADSVGVAVAYAYGTVSVHDITVNTGTIKGYDAAGGIVGRSYGESITITNCTNNADIEATSVDGGKSGGIIGIISNSGVDTCTSIVSGCTITGDSKGKFAGGITGLTNANIGTHAIKDCSVTGIAVTATDMAGGITARGGTGVTIEGCTVTSSTIKSDNIAAGIVGGNGGTGNTIAISNCDVTGIADSRTTVEAITAAAGIIASVMADDTDIIGCSVAYTDIRATDIKGRSIAGGVIGTTSSDERHSLDIDIADITFESVTIDSANDSYVTNLHYGPLEGTVVSVLGGHGTIDIDNVHDLPDYETIAQANFTGTITFKNCVTTKVMDWMIQGIDPVISIVDSTIGGIQVDSQDITILSSGDSVVKQLIAGPANGRYQIIEDAGVFEGDHNVTGTVVIGAGQTVTVGTAYVMFMVELKDADGDSRRQYSGLITGTDSASTLVVTESGEGEEYMAPGVYKWDTAESTWTSSGYTIIFDPNGGDGAPEYQVVGDDPVTLKPVRYMRDGFAFNGWNTSPDGMGTHYDTWDTFTKGEGSSITLYAEWVEGADFSIHAGDYYYLNGETYSLGASFETSVNNEGYYEGKFINTDGKETAVIVEPMGIRQTLTNGLVQHVYSVHPVSNPGYTFTMNLPETPNTFDFGMNMDHREYIFPGESGHVHLWRGGGEYESYVTQPSIGFTPYYIQDAIDLPKGEVSIVLGSGSYDLVTDFFGTSLIISVAEEAEVHIGEVRLNGRGTDQSLTLNGLMFDGADQGTVGFGHFSDITMEGCIVTDRVVTMGLSAVSGEESDKADAGTFTIRECEFVHTNPTSDLYAVTISNENMVLEDNTISGHMRGINLQGPGTGKGTVSVSGNTISGLLKDGEGAVQIADGIGGMAVTISDNTITDCKAAVAVHYGCSGTPASVTVTDNTITGTPVGILYKNNDTTGGYASQVTVEADGNLFVDADGIAGPMTVQSERDDDVSGLVDRDSWYVDLDKNTTNAELDSDVTLIDGYFAQITADGTSVTLLSEMDAVVNLDVTFPTGRVVFTGTVTDYSVTISISEVSASAGLSVMYDVSVSGAESTSYTVTLPFDHTGGAIERVEVYHYPTQTERGDAMQVVSFVSDEVTFVTPRNSLYGIVVVTETYVPPIFDDDDDYVPIPPVIVVEDSNGSGDDDAVKIVACAAAAVVAAIVAILLIVQYRKN